MPEVGPLQARAGHEARCEAAIDAMKEIQPLQETEVILLTGCPKLR